MEFAFLLARPGCHPFRLRSLELARMKTAEGHSSWESTAAATGRSPRWDRHAAPSRLGPRSPPGEEPSER